jgi:hypothetical protein
MAISLAEAIGEEGGTLLLLMISTYLPSLRLEGGGLVSTLSLNFLTKSLKIQELKKRFKDINSASLCGLAGRYYKLQPCYSVPSPHRLFRNSSTVHAPSANKGTMRLYPFSSIRIAYSSTCYL